VEIIVYSSLVSGSVFFSGVIYVLNSSASFDSDKGYVNLLLNILIDIWLLSVHIILMIRDEMCKTRCGNNTY
jgi:hypothetical protein